MKIGNKETLAAMALTGGCLSILISGVLYAFFWRVDNEPGAKDFPLLFWSAISFLSIGGVAVIAGNLYLMIRKAWKIVLITWAICVLLIAGAISLLPMLLFFMV